MAKFDWEKIRAEYEVGASQSELARRHGVSRGAIQKHIKHEGWMQDVTGAVNRLAAAKVAGVVAGCNPQKKAQALASAAEEKAEVVLRHRREWQAQQSIVERAVASQDFELAKLAKITAETIRIRQEGERRAWGIVEADVRPQAQGQSEQDAVRKGIQEAFASVGLENADFSLETTSPPPGTA